MHFSQIPSPSVDELSVACLVGRTLMWIDASGTPHCWVFHFGDGVHLTVEAPWRLISVRGIAIANIDHNQMFGLTSPVDAVAEVVASVGSRPVVGASYSQPVGDLILDFGDDWRFEVFVQSWAYDSWELWKPDGTRLVGLGGGHVAAYRADAG